MSGITYGGTLFHEYDWNLMPQHIDRFTPMNEIDMIATFLRDCGYACNSIYTVNGTSSTLYEARGALQNNFSYDSQNVQWRMFSNKKNWDKKLKDEIDALRPVLYAGGNGELEGHSFVVDGYHPTNKDLFLVNFGWGHYDGFDNKDSHYYCLKTYHDCDSVISYHNFQMALCGIQPKCSEIATLENISVSDNKNKPMYATYHGNMYLDNVNVTSSGRLICHAGSSIRLTSGTKISKGAIFQGKIMSFNCHNANSANVRMLFHGSNTNVEEDEPVFSECTDVNQSVQIYPNPTSDNFNISSFMPIKSVRLVSIHGIELKNISNTSDVISLSDINKGLYLLEIIFENGNTVTYKIIKQ